MAVVLVEHHSQQLEEQRISSFACRTQAWLGIFGDVDILLGMPNIGYSFFLVGRYHWHHLCTMLKNYRYKLMIHGGFILNRYSMYIMCKLGLTMFLTSSNILWPITCMGVFVVQ